MTATFDDRLDTILPWGAQGATNAQDIMFRQLVDILAQGRWPQAREGRRRALAQLVLLRPHVQRLTRVEMADLAMTMAPHHADLAAFFLDDDGEAAAIVARRGQLPPEVWREAALSIPAVAQRALLEREDMSEEVKRLLRQTTSRQALLADAASPPRAPSQEAEAAPAPEPAQERFWFNITGQARFNYDMESATHGTDSEDTLTVPLGSRPAAPRPEDALPVAPPPPQSFPAPEERMKILLARLDAHRHSAHTETDVENSLPEPSVFENTTIQEAIAAVRAGIISSQAWAPESVPPVPSAPPPPPPESSQDTEFCVDPYRDIVAASADWLWESDESGLFSRIEPAPLVSKEAKVPPDWQGLHLDEKLGVGFERTLSAHLPFRLARVGDWRLSGVPVFTPQGRFTGFRGVAIAGVSASSTAPPAPCPKTQSPPGDWIQSSTMAHELRSPLNAIMGFAQMIEGEILGQVDASYRAHAGQIIRQSRRILDIVDGLMRRDTNRIVSEPVVLSALLERVTATLAGEFQAGKPPLSWRSKGEGAVHIPAPEQLERALTRLLKALLNAAAPGESLDISSKMTEQGGRIRCSLPRALWAAFPGAAPLREGFDFRLVQQWLPECHGQLKWKSDTVTLILTNSD